MSSARAAVLAFCTLLIGAGLGFGAANLGGSQHTTTASAIAPPAVGKIGRAHV